MIEVYNIRYGMEKVDKKIYPHTFFNDIVLHKFNIEQAVVGSKRTNSRTEDALCKTGRRWFQNRQKKLNFGIRCQWT